MSIHQLFVSFDQGSRTRPTRSWLLGKGYEHRRIFRKVCLSTRFRSDVVSGSWGYGSEVTAGGTCVPLCYFFPVTVLRDSTPLRARYIFDTTVGGKGSENGLPPLSYSSIVPTPTPQHKSDRLDNKVKTQKLGHGSPLPLPTSTDLSFNDLFKRTVVLRYQRKEGGKLFDSRIP